MIRLVFFGCLMLEQIMGFCHKKKPLLLTQKELLKVLARKPAALRLHPRTLTTFTEQTVGSVEPNFPPDQEAGGAQTSTGGFSCSRSIDFQTISAMSSVAIDSSFLRSLIPSENMVRQNGQPTATVEAPVAAA